MNQIHSCLRCMKALDIIGIKMVVSVVSVVHSMDIFFSEVKKLVVGVVPVPSRDFLVSKHVLKSAHSLGYLKRDRMDGIWLNCEGEKLEKTKQIRLGFSKLLKILIGDENKETFIKYPTMKVIILL